MSGYADAIAPDHLAAFREALPGWFDAAQRPMPWRATDRQGRRDPYRVWLSEVMLQQTRVDQALPYFERFVAAFPTLEALAEAEQAEVLKLWEGLGYYSRARNLHRAAREVVERFGGVIPSGETEIRSLPGVGPYTTAAVLSLAYGVPLAVLDGNVIRVLTRVFAIEDHVTSGRTRRYLQELADALLDPARPGRFNESLMELGATVCTPRSPACPACPLRPVCAAAEAGRQEDFPVARKKAPVPHVDVAVGVIEDESGRLLVQQRPEDAMLGGLWEFPGGKVEPGESPEAACRREFREELGVEVEVGAPIARIAHAYSHFRITLHAFRCRVTAGEPTPAAGQPLRWVASDQLDTLAFPRANGKLIEALRQQQQSPTLF